MQRHLVVEFPLERLIQIFYHLLGLELDLVLECLTPPPPPSISTPIRRREKRKTFDSSSKMFRNYFSQFLAKVKIVASKTKKCQIFELFAIVEHCFGKPPLSRELLGEVGGAPTPLGFRTLERV